jgi:hypothetical protein
MASTYITGSKKTASVYKCNNNTFDYFDEFINKIKKISTVEILNGRACFVRKNNKNAIKMSRALFRIYDIDANTDFKVIFDRDCVRIDDVIIKKYSRESQQDSL